MSKKTGEILEENNKNETQEINEKKEENKVEEKEEVESVEKEIKENIKEKKETDKPKEQENDKKSEDKKDVNNQEKEDNKKEKKKDVEEKSEVKKQEKNKKDEIEKENDNNKDNKNEKNLKNNKKKIIISSIIIGLLILIALIFSTVFALANNGNNIIDGVNINDTDVSNLSVEELRNNLNAKYSELLTQNITLKCGEFETVITLEQIDAKIDIEEAVLKAYNQGREGNIFQNNYKILWAKMNPINIDFSVEFNEEKLKNIVDNISYSLPGTVVQSSYSIDGNNLIITKGTKGVVVEEETFKNGLIELVKVEMKNNKVDFMNIPTKEIEPNPINLEQIHQEIYKEPKDAYVQKDPFQLFVHVDGVDFNVEEAKQKLEENLEQYTIPLIITHPNITTDKLGEEAFPNVLGEFSTNYGAGASNRGINIGIAAKTINGKVLMPGEVFSYNSVIGDTTPAKGYKLGGSYLNGELVQSYGGGICQVSSTLYNAVLYANLDIVLRYNHSSAVGYVPASRDATVSYGGKDFKFKNSRKYPVKIKAVANNGVLKIQICGIKEETEYDVVIESRVTQYIPNTTKYVENSSLKKGEQVVKTAGSRGFKSVAYKVLKLNGNVISRTLLSNDTYNPMQKVVEVGTKEE